MAKNFYYIWVFVVIISSCSSDIDFSLNLAGENKKELENVLAHFENDPNSLKYKAARFIIENLPYHSSFCGDNIELYNNAYIAMATSAVEFRDGMFLRDFNFSVIILSRKVLKLQLLRQII